MLSVVMLIVIMLNVTYKPFVLTVVMLSVVRLNVVRLNVVMLSVVPPVKHLQVLYSYPFLQRLGQSGNVSSESNTLAYYGLSYAMQCFFKIGQIFLRDLFYDLR